jgi:small-conductance mechanosensitive channel
MQDVNPITDQGLVQRLQSFIEEYGLDSGLLPASLVVVAALLAGKLTHLLISATARVWTKRTITNVDDAIVDKLQFPIVASVFMFGLHLAAKVYGSDLESLATVTRILVTLGLLVWFWFFLGLSHLLLQHASGNPSKYRLVESRTFPLFENLSRVLILAGGAWALLQVWHIDTSGWLASAGIAGVALGFAAKDTLSNLFAGVFIVADAPYRIGDYIVLDSTTRGKVINIGLRSTRILTRDDVEITIPNSLIGSNQITNQSGGGSTRMRVRVKVAVGYDSDVDQVRKILTDIAVAEPSACEQPIPRVRFRRFGADGLEFELMVWVQDPSLRGITLDALNTTILGAFRDAGIEIPFPKRDVYMRSQAEG